LPELPLEMISSTMAGKLPALLDHRTLPLKKATAVIFCWKGWGAAGLMNPEIVNSKDWSEANEPERIVTVNT
jgi:hypothetical protein